MLRQDWAIVGALCLVALGFFLNFAATPLECPHHHANQPNCESFLVRTITDPISLYTLVLAVFTIVLAAASGYQGWLTRESIRLARDEFISTHRPKIIIHRVELASVATDGDDYFIGATVTFYNAGDTTAIIQAVRANLTRRRKPDQAEITIPVIAKGYEPIKSGDRGMFGVNSNFSFNAERINTVIGDTDVYLIGRIEYCDAGGRKLETGFIRCFYKIGECWMKIENTTHEYTY